MDNFFQGCIILFNLKTMKKQWTNFWEYIFTFLMEKNCVLNWIGFHFIWKLKKKEKNYLNWRNWSNFLFCNDYWLFICNCYLIAILYWEIFKRTILNKTISEAWPKLRLRAFGCTKVLVFSNLVCLTPIFWIFGSLQGSKPNIYFFGILKTFTFTSYMCLLVYQYLLNQNHGHFRGQ